MIIRTSRFFYKREDRLDITGGSKDIFGRLFSPPSRLVWDYKAGRISSEEYTKIYVPLLEERYKSRLQKETWESFFEVPQVTMVCFCKASDFCHRFLAANFLEILGCKYDGEIAPY